MKIEEFKKVKNRQRPDMCFAYEKYNSNKSIKHSIFTWDGGKTYLASITSKNLSGKLVDTDFSKSVSSIEEALQEFENFNPGVI